MARQSATIICSKRLYHLLITLEFNSNLAQFGILVVVDQRQVRGQGRLPRVGISVKRERDAVGQL